MDFTVANGAGSGDEQKDSSINSCLQLHRHDDHQNHNNSVNEDRKICNRHTSIQTQILEAFFKECPHPNDDQRRQLSRELGLDLKQIKFWFQNKRTQTKAQFDRADNSVLRADNERISCENYALKEALNNVICPACGGPPFGIEERNRSLQRLRNQNAQLKLEHENLSKFVATGKPLPPHHQIESSSSSMNMPPPQVSSLDHAIRPGGTATTRVNNRIHHAGSCSSRELKSSSSNNKMVAAVESNKAVMMETAATALEELYKLLRINEPLWIKSSIDGIRYMLDRDSYQNIFGRQLPPTSSCVDFIINNNNMSSTTTTATASAAHYESSKHAALVPMNSLDLVDAFLDSEKWADLFQTIVTHARTIQVLEVGTPRNRSGYVQLMYEQMHALSPLVPSREYYILRCCHQVEAGLWVIVDVSYNNASRSEDSAARSWRLPSGCMIQDLSNGCSKVTWVEQVEANDKSRTHPLYREILTSGLAYGAERWVASLERESQRRLTYSSLMVNNDQLQLLPQQEEGRRSVMKLAGRMVKDLCAALSMISSTAPAGVCNNNNNNVDVTVSVRQGGKRPGDPTGTIISAATSIWLPIPHQHLFHFLTDVKTRMRWDVLANGNPVYEVARISSVDGLHPGNSISLMQPAMPVEESMLLLQECFTDNNNTAGFSSSLIVYAPIDTATITAALFSNTNNNIEMMSLLPLGFTICASSPGTGDDDATTTSTTAAAAASSGSLLTAAFQMLISDPAPAPAPPPSSPHLHLQLQPHMDCIATISFLLNSTIEKIKAAFNIHASSSSSSSSSSSG